MTRRERMLKALKHEKPDEVPCCPDIAVVVPIKMQNRPFWDFYIDQEKGIFYDVFSNYMPGRMKEDFLKAYIDACNFFGIASIAYLYASPDFRDKKIEYKTKIIDKNSDRIVARTTLNTPEGSLWSETMYFIDDAPVVTKKYIKNFKDEFKFLKYFYPELDDLDFGPVHKEKEYVGDSGVNGIIVLPPSLVNLDNYVDGGLNTLGLIYFDYPDLILEYKEMHEKWSLEFTKKIIESKSCDLILTGGSGLMTWQSPKITRELSLDGLKQITKLCKENNMISHLHTCGFQKELVKMCAEETDLDGVEPLEIPPQGDCDLRDIKKEFGDKLLLKGNLHTTDVMLGDVKTVETEAIKCIGDAAEGGGYILSTGDQCGRDTPHENIFKLVDVCQKYGKY